MTNLAKRWKEEGIEEGKAESRIETARRMLTKGFEVKEIAECTDLSEEEIKDLERQVKR